MVCFRLLIFLCFATPLFSFADTCVITNEQRILWSKKYQNKIDIKVEQYGNEYVVSANFPNRLDDSRFVGVFLLKGSDWKKPQFLAQLHSSEQKRRRFIWFQVHKEYIDENYLSAVYGKGCGIEVVYRVNYPSSK